MIPGERDHTMKNREEMTFKQLIEAVKDNAHMKLPTVKYLRENCEVFVRVSIYESTITVYTNGFFVYDDGLHATVQRISNCRQNVVYEYQDDSREVIDYEVFADQPFYVRLAIEGEKRLDINTVARASGRVYSYNNSENESADLADNYDFTEAHAKRDSRAPVVNALKTGYNNLSQREKTILKKYFINNMTQQRIAKELGCSKQAVGKSYRAALKKLKDIIS